jgi:hypothetical protein
MMRCALCGLLVLMLVVGGTALADDPPPAPDQPEPPARLKKKPKPTPPPEKKPAAPPSEKKTEPGKSDDAKAEESKEKAEKEAAELEQKIQELTHRVSKNLRLAEDRLDKKDPGESTQQVQRDIVEDLDELIKQTEQRQQQQQQQQSSSSSSSQQNKQNQQARKRMQRNRSTAQQPRPRPEDQSAAQRGANLRSKSQPDSMSKIADLYKDVWGNLPETLRQEMDQYSREQFMAKYNDLLKQYYATIAEKGRKGKE